MDFNKKIDRETKRNQKELEAKYERLEKRFKNGEIKRAKGLLSMYYNQGWDIGRFLRPGETIESLEEVAKGK